MKRRIALVAQLAAGVCLAAFVGTALADNGKNPPGSPPGNSENAPGQQKKAEHAAPQAAPAQAQPAAPAASEQGAQAHGKTDKPDKPKPGKPEPAGKASKPAHAASPAKVEHPATQPAATGTAQSAGHGRSDEAHHHVIVCHRTGSDSNPYVVINIPLTAWHAGHHTHPAKNGRSDILLKDPASRPGSKDGFSKDACGARAGVAAVTTVATTTAAQTTSTTTTTSAIASAPGPTAVSGPSVAGAQGLAAAGKPTGGVLGVGGQLGQAAVKGTLPFTGLPLWSVALVALGLIGLGVALRRRWLRPTAL
jgi:hypothetical protein